jgi:hypothetical protein
MIDIEELRAMIAEVLDEVNPAYLKGSLQKKKREEEIENRSKKDTDDPSAYRQFKTDKHPKTGEQIKTKVSKWTKKAAEMGYGPSNEVAEREEDFLIEDIDFEALRAFICEAMLDEKKGGNVTKALKNKSEKSGAPMSALRAIYNKGLAAWRTGHRPGASQHQWAMARVNSVLAGGPARKVDAAQWEKIKLARGKKKKKK